MNGYNQNATNAQAIDEIKKDEIKKRFTAEVMAEYAVAKPGKWQGKPIERSGDSVRVGNKGSLKIDSNGLWSDKENGDKGGDCFDLIAEIESLDRGKDFPKIVAIAREYIGDLSFAPVKSADKQKPENNFPFSFDNFIKNEWRELSSGIQSIECQRFMESRGLDKYKLENLENVGFARCTVNAHCNIWSDKRQKYIPGFIQKNSLVFRDDSIKKIRAITYDVKQEGQRCNEIQFGECEGDAQWLPFMPWEMVETKNKLDAIPNGDLYLTEGETSAMALGFCIINGKPCYAFPCKPVKDRIKIIGELQKTHRLFLAYDNDSAGRDYTKDALAIAPNAIDISDLWSGEGWQDKADPNDFVKRYGAAAGNVIEKALPGCIERAQRRNKETTEVQKTLDLNKEISAKEKAPEKKIPEKKAESEPVKDTGRLKARRYFCNWRFDTFKSLPYDDFGRRRGVDDAIASCVNAHDDVSENVASEEFKAFSRPKYFGKEANPHLFDSYCEKAQTLAKEYDGQNHIADFCNRMKFDEYEARRWELWLYELMARALAPIIAPDGVKCDCMITIASKEQGIRKTSMFSALSNALVGEEFYGVKSKMLMEWGEHQNIEMGRHAIALIDECDKLSRGGTSELKALLSEKNAQARMPYARAAMQIQYRAIFCGTSNDASFIPADDESARRYWVIVIKPGVKLPGYDEYDVVLPMLRQAAYTVLKAYENHETNADGLPIWVEIEAESQETRTRNLRFRANDENTIALIRAAETLLKTETYKNEILSAIDWGQYASTGALGNLPAFTPIRCSAERIRKLVKQRCPMGDRTKLKRGHKPVTIIQTFAPDEAEGMDIAKEKSELHFVDDDPDTNPFIMS